jgi:hypothetical protein
MAGGPGDAEHGGSGGHAIVRRGHDAVVLAGFLAREKLFVLAGGALVHDIEIAVEVGAEPETHAIALVEDQAGVDGAPCRAVEAFEHQLDAVRALRHGVGLG